MQECLPALVGPYIGSRGGRSQQQQHPSARPGATIRVAHDTAADMPPASLSGRVRFLATSMSPTQLHAVCMVAAFGWRLAKRLGQWNQVLHAYSTFRARRRATTRCASDRRVSSAAQSRGEHDGGSDDVPSAEAPIIEPAATPSMPSSGSDSSPRSPPDGTVSSQRAATPPPPPAVPRFVVNLAAWLGPPTLGSSDAHLMLAAICELGRCYLVDQAPSSRVLAVSLRLTKRVAHLASGGDVVVSGQQLLTHLWPPGDVGLAAAAVRCCDCVAVCASGGHHRVFGGCLHSI